MQIIPPPSLALTHLISLLCNITNCDKSYPNPLTLSINSTPQNAPSSLFSQRSGVSINENEISIPFGIHEQINRKGRLVVEDEPLLPPIVQTSLGTIEGYHMSIPLKEIYAFEGIPYALPPTGKRRFQPPRAKGPWGNQTLQAKDPGPKCIQLDRGRVLGSENCLRLNIYSPKINSGAKLPVFVYVHGGAFIFGSGSWHGPAYLLAEREVILVTFNYRLGILGAFSTGDAIASGNWQLKDQNMAIQWVADHISSFGGNPSRITLVAQSAGAVSSHLQLMSSPEYKSKDKVYAAILFSGTAYNFWGLNTLEQGLRVSRSNARLAFCPTRGSSKGLLECMQKVDANLLVANQIFTVGWGFPVPMIEPKVPGAFLTMSVDEAYSAGKVAKIPIIATVTSEEINTIIAEIVARRGLPILNQVFDVDALTILGLRGKVPLNQEAELISKIRNYYGTDGQPFFLPRQFFTEVGNARFFTVPFQKGIQMHSQIAPVYGGIFNYTNNFGTPGILGLDPKEFGVTHTDDIIFLFNSTRYPSISRDISDFSITKMLINVYSNFAENGIPSYTSEETKYKFWEGVKNPEKFNLLQINEEVKMDGNPYTKSTAFWESLKLPDMTPYFKIR